MPNTETTLKATGNLADTPRIFPATQGRQAMASLRILRDEQRYDRKTGRWADTGTTQETQCRAYGAVAEAIAWMTQQGILRKGSQVIATGRLGEPAAFIRKTGEAGAVNTLTIDTLSIDSIRDAWKHMKAERNRPQPQTIPTPTPTIPAGPDTGQKEQEPAGWNTQPTGEFQ